MSAPGLRVPAERFERKYQASADPWGYRTSAYEREKYAATLAALPRRSFGRALEVGCSIGVFTELLAPRCEQLVAIDFAPRALALARERLGDIAKVDLLLAAFPEQVPAGAWDLVVCSEVLYYLDRRSLLEAAGWLHAQLFNGTSLLAVSWRGKGVEEPLRGDQAHDLLIAGLGGWHTFDGRSADYRLDLFESDAR
jgi:SAM-dependent methyltransferase